MRSKQKNIIIGIISVLLVLIITILIVLMINNIRRNNPSKEEDNKPVYTFKEESEKATTISLNNKKVKELENTYNKIKNVNTCGLNFSQEIYGNKEFVFTDMSSALKIAILEKYGNINYDNLSSLVKEINIKGENIIKGLIIPDDILSSLKENYNKLFGSNNNFYLQEEFGTCPKYYYLEKILIKEDTYCECKEEVETYDYTTKAEETESTIRIYKKIGFKLINDNGNIYSKDVDGIEILKEDNTIENTDEYFKENQDLLYTYMIVYKKDTNGKYYLYRTKRIG